ncbi:GGDEF domain-containing protein [Pelomicrobium sp. G1]|uniref:GGDEF domain-containing protein n=1 Tax=unclassified Pelomicrobium TaxID=2815318 RepID=UPI003F76B4EC
MSTFLANGLVLAGALILATCLPTLQRLMATSPTAALRHRWHLLAGMVISFIAGYLGYALVFGIENARTADLIAPGVFFGGACFVWLVTRLIWQMSQALGRVNLLEKENITDPLTQVHNRRYLDHRLGVEIAKARRYHTPLSILLLDIDHFKALNDRYGHPAGDQVLDQLAREISCAARAADVVGRYGGEEFLIIAPDTPLSDVVTLAERLRSVIAARCFTVVDMEGALQEIRVTASIGAAALDKGMNEAQELIRAADQQLYQAKGQGRNRVFPPLAQAGAITASEKNLRERYVLP